MDVFFWFLFRDVPLQLFFKTFYVVLSEAKNLLPRQVGVSEVAIVFNNPVWQTFSTVPQRPFSFLSFFLSLSLSLSLNLSRIISPVRDTNPQSLGF